MYLSGVESGMHFQHCVRAGARHCLLSYLQFYKHDQTIVRNRKKANPKMRFMVDSGAFTFITEWQKFVTWTRSEFESYLKGYVEWLKRNRDYVTIAVEYDIEHTLNMALANNPNSTIGPSIVAGWQEQYFRPLVEEGLDIIFVWHEPRGIDGWEDMCRRYSHVGMPGHFSSEPDLMNRHLSVAKRYLTRIHGFAATKQSDFRDWPWATVDSITWKTGEMYGTLIIWDERQQKLIFEDDKTKRSNYRHIIERAGFDASSIISDTNYKEVTRFGLWSMRQMEAFYERLYKTRTFYYEVRLPHWRSLIARSPKFLTRWWFKKLRADELFKQHRNANLASITENLQALAAAQYGDLTYIGANPKAASFLGAYFPKLITPLVTDPAVLQKEVANYVMPPNPPPMLRTSVDHFVGSTPPKVRIEEFSADDLEFDYNYDDFRQEVYQ